MNSTVPDTVPDCSRNVPGTALGSSPDSVPVFPVLVPGTGTMLWTAVPEAVIR